MSVAKNKKISQKSKRLLFRKTCSWLPSSLSCGYYINNFYINPVTVLPWDTAKAAWTTRLYQRSLHHRPMQAFVVAVWAHLLQWIEVPTPTVSGLHASWVHSLDRPTGQVRWQTCWPETATLLGPIQAETFTPRSIAKYELGLLVSIGQWVNELVISE